MVCWYIHLSHCHYAGLVASAKISTAGHSLSNGINQEFRLQNLHEFPILGLQATDFGCLPVYLFFLCQEFFDSWGSCDLSHITDLVVSITAAQELILPVVLQLTNVNTR